MKDALYHMDAPVNSTKKPEPEVIGRAVRSSINGILSKMGTQQSCWKLEVLDFGHWLTYGCVRTRQSHTQILRDYGCFAGLRNVQPLPSRVKFLTAHSSNPNIMRHLSFSIFTFEVDNSVVNRLKLRAKCFRHHSVQNRVKEDALKGP